MKKALRQVPAAPSAPAAKAEAPPATDLLSVPMPQLRPVMPDDATLGYAPANGLEATPLVPGPQARPPVASVPPIDQPPARNSTCGAVIAELGVEATPLAPVVTAPAAFRRRSPSRGSNAAPSPCRPTALLNCSLAETLAAWMDNTVQPIALDTLGARVTGLRIAASYSCRNRDSLADAKLSEHARGNAIDISAFKVDGIGWIEVESGWNGGDDKADFLREVRGSACGPFTTVLGPGSDCLSLNPLPPRPRQAAHGRPQQGALLQIGSGSGHRVQPPPCGESLSGRHLRHAVRGEAGHHPVRRRQAGLDDRLPVDGE